MKPNLILLICTLFGHLLYAQPSGFSPVKDLIPFKSQFALASQKVESIESNFTQIKNLSLLKDKIQSKGKFFYKKGNKVRIEYSSPYYYLMVLNQNAMTIKDDQKTSSYNTKSNKIMQSINNIMLDCMRGTIYGNNDFMVEASESAKEYLLKMKPITATMKKIFTHIEVFLDKKDFHVLRLNLVECNGDNSLMTFHQPIMNKNISDALFSVK
jgi:outer membrane lipoprotein-sorting protein